MAINTSAAAGAAHSSTRYSDFWKIALPVLATGLALTTIFIGSIPGVHGDEAWVVLRVTKIANGARPFSGMNFYTGALNEYLAWPFLAATGYQFWALRLASALINVGAVLLALDIVRTLHPDDPSVWRWTGALWVTSVPFVLFSRFAVEMNMLSPALLLGAIWLLSVALRSESAAAIWMYGMGSGFLLGVAVYNHAVELGIVAAFGLGALAGFGLGLLRRRITWPVIVGLCIGMTPTVFRMARAGYRMTPKTVAQGVRPSFSHEVSGAFFTLASLLPSLQELRSDLAVLPGLLASIVDGGVMFQRFTGERLVPVIPYFSVALLGLGAASLWRVRRQRINRIDRAMLVAWLAMPITPLLIAPYLALGYLAFPTLVAPYALVRFAMPPEHGAAASPVYRRIGRLVIVAVLTIQVGYIGVDYFWAFARSGGRPSRFDLGMRLVETSDDFIRTQRLYQQLVAAGVNEVIAPELLLWALKVQDVQFHRMQWTPRDNFGKALESPRTKVGRVAFVDSVIARPKDFTVSVLQTMNEQRFGAGGLVYVRASGFDPNFIVFIADRQ